jgi:hypothetical protein
MRLQRAPHPPQKLLLHLHNNGMCFWTLPLEMRGRLNAARIELTVSQGELVAWVGAEGSIEQNGCHVV